MVGLAGTVGVAKESVRTSPVEMQTATSGRCRHRTRSWPGWPACPSSPEPFPPFPCFLPFTVVPFIVHHVSFHTPQLVLSSRFQIRSSSLLVMSFLVLLLSPDAIRQWHHYFPCLRMHFHGKRLYRSLHRLQFYLGQQASRYMSSLSWAHDTQTQQLLWRLPSRTS